MSDYSAAMAADMFARQSSGVRVDLLEIDAAGLPAPIRLVNDVSDMVHAGQTYAAARFDIGLPEEGESIAQPIMSLTLEGVSRDYIAALRAATGKFKVGITSVLRGDPDDGGLGWVRGEAGGLGFGQAITAKVTVWPLLDRALSSKLMDQVNAPGLY